MDKLSALQNNLNLILSSGIKDVSLKTDLDHYLTPEHKLRYGGSFTHHRFSPSVITGKQDSVDFLPNNAQLKYAYETAAYVQDDWEVNERLKLNLGLRWSGFQQTGPYKSYTTDRNGNRLDSSMYASGETVRFYGGLEPRATMRYTLNDQTSLKASVSRNRQYIHLVSNAGTTLP